MSREAGSLFPELLFPEWLPGESTYSLVARLHRMSCHTRSGVTCRRFFGARSDGWQHDFPTAIERFAAHTQYFYGDARQIEKATLLPFFSLFVPIATSPEPTFGRPLSSGGLKYFATVIMGPIVGGNPLKACASCILADYANFGVAYWHLEHQLPSTWICSIHDRALKYTLRSATQKANRAFLLPEDEQIVWEEVQAAEEGKMVLRRLAASGKEVAASFRPNLRTASVQTAFRLEMGNHNFHTWQSNLAPRMVVGICPDLFQLSGHTTPHLASLLKSHGRLHPLRFLLAVDLVFGRFDNFLNKYKIL